MGLYLYFFQQEEYQLKYNCSFYSVEDLPLDKRRRPIFAMTVLFLGIFNELMYIPCLYAMFHKKVRQAFCYKLMILMALYDMFTLPLTAFIPALYSYNGWMFCSHPTLTFMAGGIIFPLWIGYCLVSLILAINRCLAFSSYKWIFNGFWREMAWLSIPPVASIIVALFGQSITYNSVLGAWFFNPHLGYYEDTNNTYPSDLQFYNNIVFCTVLPVVYCSFFINNYTLSKKRMSGMSSKEYRLFIQCLVMNFTIVLAAAGYMGMQYLNLPEEIICFSHVSWIIIEGAPPIVLLLMNETIRKIVFKRGGSKVSTQCPSTNAPPSMTHGQTLTVTPYREQEIEEEDCGI